MLSCPHCGSDIDFAKLDHPSIFANFRQCPVCSQPFTVDSKTRLRQALAIIVAIVALIYTILMYFQGTAWLFHSLASYVILALLVWFGNKRVRLVPYRRR